MFVTVKFLKYALLVSQWSYGHFLKPTDSILFEKHNKSSPLNYRNYFELYPQNGDRIVNIDYATLFHPVYTADLYIDCKNVNECYSFLRLHWWISQWNCGLQVDWNCCIPYTPLPRRRRGGPYDTDVDRAAVLSSHSLSHYHPVLLLYRPYAVAVSSS